MNYIECTTILQQIVILVVGIHRFVTKSSVDLFNAVLRALVEKDAVREFAIGILNFETVAARSISLAYPLGHVNSHAVRHGIDGEAADCLVVPMGVESGAEIATVVSAFTIVSRIEACSAFGAHFLDEIILSIRNLGMVVAATTIEIIVASMFNLRPNEITGGGSRRRI